MNKDDAREAAVTELHAKQFVEGRDLRFFGAGFERGFDAGAASVDRRAIVEKAFVMVKLIAGQRIEDDLVKYGKTTNEPYFHEAMDAVLAEMGVKDE